MVNQTGVILYTSHHVPVDAGLDYERQDKRRPLLLEVWFQGGGGVRVVGDGVRVAGDGCSELRGNT